MGTPCQCVALSKFLGGDNEKLTLCDFICRGVNAPNAYMAYLQELEERYQSEIQKVWFKIRNMVGIILELKLYLRMERSIMHREMMIRLCTGTLKRTEFVYEILLQSM